MKTDAIVKKEGMEILLKALGFVDAERFVSLVIRASFDYSTWHQTLFEEESLRDLSKKAMDALENK